MFCDWPNSTFHSELETCFWTNGFPVNFSEAVILCSKRGGDLAVPNSANASDFVDKFLQHLGIQEVWLGIYDEGENWIGSSGGNISWTNWLNETDPGGGSCVIVDRNKMWYNHRCNATDGHVVYVLCEKSNVQHTDCQIIPNSYHLSKGDFCHWINDRTVTFSEGVDFCKIYGGWPSTFGPKRSDAVFGNLLININYDYVWIGVNKFEGSSTWERWPEAASHPDWFNWATNEPTDRTGGCVFASIVASYSPLTWATDDCANEKIILCELKQSRSIEMSTHPTTAYISSTSTKQLAESTVTGSKSYVFSSEVSTDLSNGYITSTSTDWLSENTETTRRVSEPTTSDQRTPGISLTSPVLSENSLYSISVSTTEDKYPKSTESTSIEMSTHPSIANMTSVSTENVAASMVTTNSNSSVYSSEISTQSNNGYITPTPTDHLSESTATMRHGFASESTSNHTTRGNSVTSTVPSTNTYSTTLSQTEENYRKSTGRSPPIIYSRCICRKVSNVSLHLRLRTIKVNLELNPKDLSKYHRKYETQPDNRHSSRVIGSVGILLVIFGLVLSLVSHPSRPSQRTSRKDVPSNKKRQGKDKVKGGRSDK